MPSLFFVGEKKSFENVEVAVCEIRNIIELGKIVFENVDKAVFQIDNRNVTVIKNLREKGKKADKTGF